MSSAPSAIDCERVQNCTGDFTFTLLSKTSLSLYVLTAIFQVNLGQPVPIPLFHGLASPISPGGLPTLSLTTNSSWLPWERVAIPPISPMMPVHPSVHQCIEFLHVFTSSIFTCGSCACFQSLSIKLMDIFKQAYRKLARMMVEEVCSLICLKI